MAALDSTKRRLDLLLRKDPPTPAEKAEVKALEAFAAALGPIDASNFSKFRSLSGHLKSKEFGWRPDDPADRLVIFSERIETLNWLKQELPPALGIKPERIEILHGTLTDTERRSWSIASAAAPILSGCFFAPTSRPKVSTCITSVIAWCISTFPGR
jgi:hypothetical protein